jgi:DNA-binding MarR family transcriptional regulator
MSTEPTPAPPESGQWLDLGLDAVEPGLAGRVRLFRRLMATAAVFRGQIDTLFAGAGVTSQQAALLQLIEAQPAPPTLGQVAQALRMTHQNAKQIALALQRKGFLDIVVDPADRRARRLQLTDLHQVPASVRRWHASLVWRAATTWCSSFPRAARRRRAWCRACVDCA